MSLADADVETVVREIIREHGKIKSIASVKAGDDLYKLGLSSLATVNVMMDLEGRFGLTIPEEALTRATFQSIGALTALVRRLRGEGGAS